MIADGDKLDDWQPSPEGQTPMPRELAVAAGVLVIIMVVMSMALWFVAGAAQPRQGQATSNPSTAAPTAQLLQMLADDLGTNTTPGDLHDAVTGWLQRQPHAITAMMVASSSAAVADS